MMARAETLFYISDGVAERNSKLMLPLMQQWKEKGGSYISGRRGAGE